MKRLIAVILCVATVFSLSACLSSNSTESEINIYFKGISTNDLVVEKVKYTNSQNTVDMANFAMKRLITGPENDFLASTLPQGTEYGKISVKNEIANVDFSKEFTACSGVDELIARFSVVRTLCDIPGISAVVITVEGLPLVSNSTGKEVGLISKKDIVLDVTTNVDTESETTLLQLYFASSDATYLKAETRKVVTADTVSIEKTVINELLKGPSSHELIAVIPSGTKLHNIETRDGVCYVNFSSDFVSKFSGGTNTGLLIVYSIVNSLCSLENVDSVQILIEGEKGATFGDFVFDEPLLEKQSIVQKD
ncbi:MAG: GerMN domain-containing protein [Clostridia bacterium]